MAGYCKINEFKAQSDIFDSQSLEIERIYVENKYQGNGLGIFIINKLISIANERNKVYLWLGVWKMNTKAINFYKKSGFYIIGDHSFFIGEDEQDDFIMRKNLI